MKKQHILIALIVLALTLVAAAFMMFTGTDNTTQQTSTPPEEDVLDVVSAFYESWLEAIKGTEGVSKDELLNSPLLSASVRTKVATALDTNEPEMQDPVLCQVVPPDRIGGRVLFAQPTEAQVMMLARGLETPSPYQAIVSVIAVNGQWQISDITCSQGETAPQRDYDFEREGFLLKQVPPPLNPDFWHLVYEENGQMGRTVPLTFTENSVCVLANGEEQPCDESSFRDATKVTVRADMSETGATVRRLEF